MKITAGSNNDAGENEEVEIVDEFSQSASQPGMADNRGQSGAEIQDDDERCRAKTLEKCPVQYKRKHEDNQIKPGVVWRVGAIWRFIDHDRDERGRQHEKGNSENAIIPLSEWSEQDRKKDTD